MIPGSLALPAAEITGVPFPAGTYLAAYKFDESSGTTITDDSGNSRPFTLSSESIRTSSGKINRGLQFNGAANAERSGTNTLGFSSNTFGFCCWVYRPSSGGICNMYSLNYLSNATIATSNYGLRWVTGESFDLQFRIEQERIAGYNGNLRGNWSTDLILEEDLWSLVVCNRNSSGASATVWDAVNGRRDASISASLSTLNRFGSANSSYIGAVRNGTTGPVGQSSTGWRIDMLALRYAEFTNQDIIDLWNNGNGNQI